MTREEFYNLTDILNSEVLGNFMHGGEADELIAMFEEAVDHSNILEQEEPVSEDLEEAAWLQYDRNKPPMPPELDLHKEFIDFFKAGAKLQKNHLWKDAQGDDLPEYEREVVVFTQNFPDDAGMMMVAIGHRPTPEGYDGKSLTTGEIKHYTPKTYDKGGWNIPDVKYWLDVELPKEIEL